MEIQMLQLLPLETKIAGEFHNIPGLPHAEIGLAAQEALAHAARLFDAAKGDFTAYAPRAMRNTLRDLYERQVRHHPHHVYNLDLPVTQSGTTPEARVQQITFHGFPARFRQHEWHTHQLLETRLRGLELRRLPLPTRHREIPLPLRSQARPHRHHPQQKTCPHPRPHARAGEKPRRRH